MSELEVIRRTRSLPATVVSIRRDLESIGVVHGSILLVHSFLSSLGWVCGGPVVVNQALKDAVGEMGTIVMPTHSSELSDPSDWRNHVNYKKSLLIVLQELTSLLVSRLNRYLAGMNTLQNLIWNVGEAVHFIWQLVRYVLAFLLALCQRRATLAAAPGYPKPTRCLQAPDPGKEGLTPTVHTWLPSSVGLALEAPNLLAKRRSPDAARHRQEVV